MRTLTRLIGTTLSAAVVIAALQATAITAEAQTIKMGYADAELVLVNLPDYKANAEKVQRQVASSQQELELLSNELQEDMQKFEKQRPILSPEKLEERQRELQQRYLELQKQGATKEEELARFEADLMNPLIEKVSNAVDAVAEAKGLDIVFKSPGLLYVNPETVTDITLDVARRLGIKVDETPETAAAPAP